MQRKKIKVIALYLPQFHQIPENDEFWGKGFTDWEAVKKAKPIFEEHIQPRIPLNKNYYDLSKEENVEWQAKLAHDGGIYGFGVYHYWFNNEKNLLTKPAEILRDSKIGNVKYFFIWDNNNWIRSWSNVKGNAWAPTAENFSNKKKETPVLIPYILGSEPDWENHYNYLRNHFKSDNYEKVDNKPIYCILSFSKEMQNMCQYWNQLAKKDGFNGIFFVIMRFKRNENLNWVCKYTYQPHFVSLWKLTFMQKIVRKIMGKLRIKHKDELRYFDYDRAWNSVLKQSEKDTDRSIINCGFIDYDDSPRRGTTRGTIFKGATPEKFKKYFRKLVEISEAQGKEYLFLTAWNEWGEGAYLEPDENNGMKYLDAVRDVLNGELT